MINFIEKYHKFHNGLTIKYQNVKNFALRVIEA